MRYISFLTIMFFLSPLMSLPDFPYKDLLEDTDEITKNIAPFCYFNEYTCNDSKLRLHKLVSNIIHSCHAKTKYLCVEDEAVLNSVYSPNIQADLVQSLDLNTNNLCAQNIQATNLCATQLTAQDVCIGGSLTHSNDYRAFVGLTHSTTYTLGDKITYDTIIDDPHGNITQNPTTYTVPVSGYYIATFAVRQEDLSGDHVIAGSPVAQPAILVNNIPVANAFQPFLAFTTIQPSTITSLLHLNMGDKVTTTYSVLLPDLSLGTISYPGTAVLSGNVYPQLYTTSFQIHYLSSDSLVDCTPCVPCQPVSIYGTPCNSYWNESQMCCPC